MGTQSNALDCGLSVVKEQENVAALSPLYTWVGSVQTFETQRKIFVVSKPTLSSPSVSCAFIAAIWHFLAFLILPPKSLQGQQISPNYAQILLKCFPSIPKKTPHLFSPVQIARNSSLFISLCVTFKDPAWTLCLDEIIYLFTVWLAWEFSRALIQLKFQLFYTLYEILNCSMIHYLFYSNSGFDHASEIANHLFHSHLLLSFLFQQCPVSGLCFLFLKALSEKRPSRTSISLNSTPKQANIKMWTAIFFFHGWIIFGLSAPAPFHQRWDSCTG